MSEQEFLDRLSEKRDPEWHVTKGKIRCGAYICPAFAVSDGCRDELSDHLYARIILASDSSSLDNPEIGLRRKILEALGLME